MGRPVPEKHISVQRIVLVHPALKFNSDFSIVKTILEQDGFRFRFAGSDVVSHTLYFG